MKNTFGLYAIDNISVGIISQLAITLSFFEKNQNAPSQFLLRLNLIVQQNYDNEAFNVTTLSKMMGLCPMQFHRKVKEQTGLTPGKYLLLFRFEKATHLLLSSEDTIGEIAFLSGFSNQNNFTRAFKREFGCCPKRLRQDRLKSYK